LPGRPSAIVGLTVPSNTYGTPVPIAIHERPRRGHDLRSFERLAEQLQSRLRAEIDPDHHHKVSFRRGPTPELRRVLVRAHCHVEELRRLHDRSSTPQSFEHQSLYDTLSIAPDWRDVVMAWSLTDELARQVIELADDPMLATLLAAETTCRLSQPDSPAVTWSSMFDLDELATLISAFRAGEPTADQRKRAKACLTALALRRSELGNRQRAEQETRARYVVRWTQILFPLVAALTAVAAMAMTSTWTPWSVAVCILAGALGSTLSGAIQVRQLTRITALRSLRGGMFAQPVIGAAAAVFLLLLLESHVLVLPGTTSAAAPSWSALGTYGFLAGFSEPFFFGTVRRITGMAEGPATEDRPAGAGAAAIR
jgi:hypothetical protein